jgi:HopA1 effector protein family
MIAPRCLVELVEATALDPPSCSWLGECRRLTGAADGGAEATTHGLARRLYADFYVTGGVAPSAPPPARPWWAPGAIRDLPSSNTGTGSRQERWTVVGREGAVIVVERNGLRVRVDAARVRSGAGGTEVLLPSESIGQPSGFYTAYGDAGGCEPADGAVDRYYWNVRGAGRAALLAEVTAVLNRRFLPFRLKVLNDPDAERCDAAVLYTPTAIRGDIAPVVTEISRSLRAVLRVRVPGLAKPLGSGVAFAEDPGGDESFGTHRCLLIADALLTAHASGVVADEGRLGAIADRFAREGLSLERPHLNPGSDPRRDPPTFA